MSEFLTTPISEIMEKFTKLEIKQVQGSAVDRAENPAQLWAHWFGTHCKNDAEFIGERGSRNDELNQFMIKLVHRVDKLMN